MLCGPSRALCHIFKSSEVETFLALALTLYRFGQSACLMSAVSMSNAEQDATQLTTKVPADPDLLLVHQPTGLILVSLYSKHTFFLVRVP